MGLYVGQHEEEPHHRRVWPHATVIRGEKSDRLARIDATGGMEGEYRRFVTTPESTDSNSSSRGSRGDSATNA